MKLSEVETDCEDIREAKVRQIVPVSKLLCCDHVFAKRKPVRWLFQRFHLKLKCYTIFKSFVSTWLPQLFLMLYELCILLLLSFFWFIRQGRPDHAFIITQIDSWKDIQKTITVSHSLLLTTDAANQAEWFTALFFSENLRVRGEYEVALRSTSWTCSVSLKMTKSFVHTRNNIVR